MSVVHFVIEKARSRVGSMLLRANVRLDLKMGFLIPREVLCKRIVKSIFDPLCLAVHPSHFPGLFQDSNPRFDNIACLMFAR